MKRNFLNYLVDAITFIVLFLIVMTGLFIRYVLPPGSGREKLQLLGWGRHEWGDFHFWLSVAMGLLFVAHIALHWNWVCTMTLRLFHPKSAPRMEAWKRNLAGCGFLVGLSGLVVGLTLLAQSGAEAGGHGSGSGRGHGWGRRAHERTVEAPTSVPRKEETDEREHEREKESAGKTNEEGGHGRRGGGMLRGSSTFKEAADHAGLCVKHLCRLLELPEDIPADARLGPTIREHGLEMSAVRRAIEEAIEVGVPGCDHKP
jgi:hypothetical protein